MRTLLVIPLLWLAVVSTGCGRTVSAEATDTATVNGDVIRFAPDAPQLTSITVEPAGVEPATAARLFGHLAWNEDATVRVFTPFAGRVHRVRVDLGGRIERGTPLAEIESADFGQAQAEARGAESDDRLAESNLARLRELYDHGAAPLKEVQAAEAEVERAASQRAQAHARLAAYDASADSVDGIFLLRSPIAGQIVERSVTPGQEVRPDQMLANAPQLFTPLFVISDPSRLWLEIDATEAEVDCLQPGVRFRFESSAMPGRHFEGTLDRISNAVDPETHTIKARGLVEHADKALKAQMLVTVEVSCPSAHPVRVPAEAVILQGERHFVFVEGPPGTFTRREIQVGAERESWVVVSSGIAAGDRVVTEGAILLEQMLD